VDTYLITWRPWTVLNIFAMFVLFMLVFYLICRLGKWGTKSFSPQTNQSPSSIVTPNPYGYA